MEIAANQNVLRLQVSVENVVIVQVLDGHNELAQVDEGIFNAQLSVGFYKLF